MVRSWLSRSHSGAREIAGLAVLYGLYEVARGAGGENVRVAMQNTADIVAFERAAGLYVEQVSRELSPMRLRCSGCSTCCSTSQGPQSRLRIHRRHPDRFPIVRTTFVGATALALVGYVFYPAAPPRLAELGFSDTVTSSTGLRPELRPARGAVQPVRRRPEPPLRLRADRRCRSRGTASRRWVPDRRRALPGRDAPDHRRHRQPLLRGRRPRWARGGRRLARGSRARRRARAPRPAPRVATSRARRQPYSRGVGGHTAGHQSSLPRFARRGDSLGTPTQPHLEIPMSPLKRSNNIAARMGRWSARHRKTAIFGWLAFVVAAVVIGGVVGTKQLGENDTLPGESGKAARILEDGSSSLPARPCSSRASRSRRAASRSGRPSRTSRAGVRPGRRRQRREPVRRRQRRPDLGRRPLRDRQLRHPRGTPRRPSTRSIR